MEEELLSPEEVAEYLGIGSVTVWRWCRDGTLPCAKIGRSWRIRRSALEEFVRKSERSNTLVGRLRTFLEVPDNVLAIAQTRELMLNLDTAFFRVGQARGGALVKYYVVEAGKSVDKLRAELERRGLEVTRLEDQGKLRFIAESGEPGERTQELRGLVAEEADNDRSIWVDYDWEDRFDVEAALKQQAAITGLIGDTDLVVKTTILEQHLDDWPGAWQRRVQVMHSGTVWLSEAGLALSRVVPPPVL